MWTSRNKQIKNESFSNTERKYYLFSFDIGDTIIYHNITDDFMAHMFLNTNIGHFVSCHRYYHSRIILTEKHL